jgi:hypothetical protein
MFRGCLTHQKRALEADIHRRVPRRFWKRLQFSWNDLHCVVHDNVDTPALLDNRLHKAIDVGGLGDVGRNREALAAERRGLLCRRLGRRGIHVVDDDMGPFTRVHQNYIAADAAAAASDQRHLVLQSHGVPPRLCGNKQEKSR